MGIYSQIGNKGRTNPVDETKCTTCNHRRDVHYGGPLKKCMVECDCPSFTKDETNDVE